MTHNDIYRLYLAHTERSLDAATRSQFDEHLSACSSCRQFVDRMTSLLEPRGGQRADQLTADPFLPTRVRAIVESSRTTTTRQWRPAVEWSLASVAIALGIFLGVMLGSGLAKPSPSINETQLVSEFASNITPSNFSDKWMSLEESTTSTTSSTEGVRK